VGKQECILDLNQKPFLNAVAHVWDKSSGDPTKPQPEGVPRKVTIPFKGRFLPGTYVFPFEFPPLPRDAAEFQMDVKLTAPKHTRIHLPCSHSFSMTTGWIGWNGYSVGVNIKKDKLTDENAEWTYPFDYFPRGRPFVSPPSPFPFIATREDWPLAREDVGGWTLTPFGGRGRWRGETMVEIEGLLGVQAPPVLAPGQRLRFGLLLWCTNPEVLAALSLPGAFQVDFLRSDTFGLDVLDPHNSARKNRHLTRIGAPGRVWAADGPVPADDEPSVPPLVPRAGAIRKGMTAEEYAKRGKEMSVFTITQSGLGGTRAMEYAGEANVEESAVDLGELSRRRLQALGLSPVPPSNPSPSQAPQAGPSSLKLKPTPLTALTTVTMSSSASPATDIKREWLARSTIASSVNVSISSNAPLLPADKGKSAMPAQSIASESVSDLGSILDALESVPVLNADAPQSHLPRNEPLSPLDGEMREDLRVPSPTQSFEEEDEEEESKGKDGIKDVKSSASPAAEPAFDGVDEDDEAAHTTRLDGDLVIPDVTPPSYRWKYQVCIYIASSIKGADDVEGHGVRSTPLDPASRLPPPLSESAERARGGDTAVDRDGFTEGGRRRCAAVVATQEPRDHAQGRSGNPCASERVPGAEDDWRRHGRGPSHLARCAYLGILVGQWAVSRLPGTLYVTYILLICVNYHTFTCM
jgi:hypothetical protein